MKLFRFHLSTLLLLCLCAGASLGIYMDRNIWRLEKSVTVERNVGPPAIRIGHEYPWIYQSRAILEKERVSVTLFGGFTEMSVFQWSDHLPQRCIETFVRHGTEDWRKVSSIDAGSAVYWIMYSPDGQRLAVSLSERIDIHRRTRDHGFLGLLKLPLFWVAALSAVALILIFLRWSLRHSPAVARTKRGRCASMT